MSMAPKQPVGAVEVRVVYVSPGTESVDYNGVLVETQACYVEDITGKIKVQLWERLIGKLILGCCQDNKITFQDKQYLTTTRYTEIKEIDPLSGLTSDPNFIVDEGEVITVVAKIGAVEATISRRCSICSAWQLEFDYKKRFHRCGRCNKLQSVGCFQPQATMSINLLGNTEDLILSNTVIKKYLTKENALHLLMDPQDLEEHFIENEMFKVKMQNNNIIEIDKAVAAVAAGAPVVGEINVIAIDQAVDATAGGAPVVGEINVIDIDQVVDAAAGGAPVEGEINVIEIDQVVDAAAGGAPVEGEINVIEIDEAVVDAAAASVPVEGWI